LTDRYINEHCVLNQLIDRPMLSAFS